MTVRLIHGIIFLCIYLYNYARARFDDLELDLNFENVCLQPAEEVSVAVW